MNMYNSIKIDYMASESLVFPFVLKKLTLYKKNGNFNRRQREFFLDVNHPSLLIIMPASVYMTF